MCHFPTLHFRIVVFKPRKRWDGYHLLFICLPIYYYINILLSILIFIFLLWCGGHTWQFSRLTLALCLGITPGGLKDWATVNTMILAPRCLFWTSNGTKNKSESWWFSKKSKPGNSLNMTSHWDQKAFRIWISHHFFSQYVTRLTHRQV